MPRDSRFRNRLGTGTLKTTVPFLGRKRQSMGWPLASVVSRDVFQNGEATEPAATPSDAADQPAPRARLARLSRRARPPRPRSARRRGRSKDRSPRRRIEKSASETRFGKHNGSRGGRDAPGAVPHHDRAPDSHADHRVRCGTCARGTPLRSRSGPAAPRRAPRSTESLNGNGNVRCAAFSNSHRSRRRRGFAGARAGRRGKSRPSCVGPP